MFDFGMPKVPSVEVKDLYQAILDKKDFILLDVRTPMEFANHKIAGAINLPLDQVPAKIEETLSNKEQLIYVYCLSGSRSIVAVNEMRKLGYKNVFDVSHGLMAWRVNKFPLV
jgi:phage shock protein E